MSETPTTSRRIAILGGDGKHRECERWAAHGSVVHFPARGDGGNGGLRRLKTALRAGGIDHVVILSRWNSHSATVAVRRVCKLYAISVEIVR